MKSEAHTLVIEERSNNKLYVFVREAGDKDGLWQQVLKKKYLKGRTLSQVVKKKGDSHFWAGLMEVKDLVLQRGRFRVHDGSQTRFWEELWLGKEPLMVRYPSLYRIVRKKNLSVAQVLSTTPLNVSFRRALVGDNWAKWLELVGDVLWVNLNDRKDSFFWMANKTFSVKNMYNDLVLREGTPVNGWAWKAKIPLKIKIFLWYLKQGVVLTKDNLVKRQWKGCTNYCFCAEQETIQHLFFDCPIARLTWGSVCLTFGVKKPEGVEHLFGPWFRSFSSKQRNLVLVGLAAICWALWISRNDLVFQKSHYKSILQVIFRGTFWIRTWSVLSNHEGRTILKDGCRALEGASLEIFNKSGWNALKRIGN
jgi:hypothetical protein